MAKFYVVKQGRQTGIFKTWAECEAQVKGFAGAEFKSFPTDLLAERYLNGINEPKPVQPAPYSPVKPDLGPKSKRDIKIYTDGSFIEGKGYAWAYTIEQRGEIISENFGVGTNEEAASMRNVAGELAATIRAVVESYDRGYKHIHICHDYLGVSLWAEGGWKAKNKFTQWYATFMQHKMVDMDITFEHVKGHTGVEGNEHVDELCRRAFEEAGL